MGQDVIPEQIKQWDRVTIDNVPLGIGTVIKVVPLQKGKTLIVEFKVGKAKVKKAFKETQVTKI